MTEEFIPRDTPIYLMVDKTNKTEIESAINTRNIWSDVYKFNNIKIQNTSLKITQSLMHDLIGSHHRVDYSNKNLIDNVARLSIFRKNRKINHSHIIIIDYNDALMKDIPKSVFNFDFFSLKKFYDDPNLEFSGLIISKKMCIDTMKAFKIVANRSKDPESGIGFDTYKWFGFNNWELAKYLFRTYNEDKNDQFLNNLFANSNSTIFDYDYAAKI